MNREALAKTWDAVTLPQKLLALGTVIGVVLFFMLFVSQTTRENQALLFSGLDTRAAGDVLTELDNLGTPYTVKGSAIYVPNEQRDKLRLELARQGLPQAGGAGYELLDTLNGFSTTADMFDAAYWRAKEGELTRTILAMPTIKNARVHLGITRQSAFRRQSADKTASVTIDSPLGLTAEQARSVQYLTALAVPNLPPESVVVIDTQRGVIAGPGAPGEEIPGGDAETRATTLEARLTRLLEAHVGQGNARVTVSMDVDRESVAQTERLIDPDSRQIATRTFLEERDTEEPAGGVVTVASNLPDGEAAIEGEEENPLLRLKRNEQVTYTGSEIERVTQKTAGDLRRQSIAVLINERFTVNDEGENVPAPRSDEELQALEALIRSAAGIDPARGDILTLRTLPFERPVLEEPTPLTFVEQYMMPRAMDLVQIAFLGVVTLVLGLFVLRPLLSPRAPVIETAEIEEAQSGAPALPADAAELLTMLTEEHPDDAAAILDAWFEEEGEPHAA